MPSLHGIYASTSGHTEYVLQVLTEHLENEKCTSRRQGYGRQEMQNVKWDIVRVEQATVDDFDKGDMLLLASGTWNTGGVEGQLNPHMHVFLNTKAPDVDLKGKKCTVIGLGDERYRYTCRAADHLEQWVKAHGGELACESLRIVNEPYGQEEKVRGWASQFPNVLTS